MEKRELICIGCPMGCPLVVELDGAEIVSVSGYTCKRGDVYARKEVTNPTRIVTSTGPHRRRDPVGCGRVRCEYCRDETGAVAERSTGWRKRRNWVSPT